MKQKISIWLTAKERTALAKKAKHAAMSRSEYVGRFLISDLTK
jgi:hypothetical protein